MSNLEGVAGFGTTATGMEKKSGCMEPSGRRAAAHTQPTPHL